MSSPLPSLCYPKLKYIINTETNSYKRLNDDTTGSMDQLKWSANGDSLAYSTYRHLGGGSGQFIAIEVGNGQTVARSSLQRPVADWTPDLELIVSESIGEQPEGHQDNTEISIKSLKDNSMFQMIQLTVNGFCDVFPAWSPDQQQIAFLSDREGWFELYVMNIDGSNQTKLSNTQENVIQFQWSPDGKKIAYVTRVESFLEIKSELYVVDIETEQEIQLTNIPEQEEHLPLWSPDGQQISFLAGEEGKWHIFSFRQVGIDKKPWIITQSNEH